MGTKRENSNQIAVLSFGAQDRTRTYMPLSTRT